MVAFTPHGRPAVAIAGDGTLAAISDGPRLVVLELPGGAPFAEADIEADAEVGWLGAPPRLLVVAGQRLRLVDPFGARTIAELRLEAPMNLRAWVGAHALLVGATGTVVVSATDTQLIQHAFPLRSVPACAGAAGTSFVVALAESIEEWDPASRMPRRRHRLAEPAAITAVGGSDRVVWRVTDPARIDVIPVVERGQPREHELPEPIARIAGHPRSDLVVCVGAETGRLFVVDLDGRSRLRILGVDGIDHAAATGLIVGRITGVLAAQPERPIAIVPLDERAVEIEVTSPPPLEPARPPAPPQLSWRDGLVAWTLAADRTPPIAVPIDVLAARFDLPAELVPALSLLYGAHLCGQRGASPADLARVTGSWAEALGTGQLAQRGLARYVDSRVLLAPALQRTLDELPVTTGVLVGQPGAVRLLGPRLVVSAESSLSVLAARYAGHVAGAILAAYDDADPEALFLEARARGAVPMLRIIADDIVELGMDPAVLVVEDEATAAQLVVPRL